MFVVSVHVYFRPLSENYVSTKRLINFRLHFSYFAGFFCFPFLDAHLLQLGEAQYRSYFFCIFIVRTEGYITYDSTAGVSCRPQTSSLV